MKKPSFVSGKGFCKKPSLEVASFRKMCECDSIVFEDASVVRVDDVLAAVLHEHDEAGAAHLLPAFLSRCPRSGCSR